MIDPKIKLIIFDLDGTLTKSKSPMDNDMANLLVKLIEKIKVAVISGGGFPQFQSQFLASLPGSADNMRNLYLLPTSGTRLYSWKGNWTEEYSMNLSQKEKEQIIMAMKSSLITANYQKPERQFGDLIEDRGSQVTFSALGQSAPADLKYAWDPDRSKRNKIATTLSPKLPEFDVRIGGSTSIDVTRRGVNKAYGIRRLEDFLHIESDQIVFVGDALFYGGNDYPAKATGVDCVSVKGPDDTKRVIMGWLE